MKKIYDCRMDALTSIPEDFDHVDEIRFTDDFKTEVTGEKYEEYDYEDFIEEIDELDDLMIKSSIITDPKSRK
jgi:hypothetical protein